MKEYTTILGVNVSIINYPETLKRVSRWIETKKKNYVCVAATHLIMESQNNQLLRRGVNRAGLVTPDGMPLVWLSKLHRQKNIERVYGPTLMLKICRLAETKKWKVFLLGGSKGQGKILTTKLKHRFPDLIIVGYQDTPNKLISKKDNSLIAKQINRSQTQIVFVGLGCPYQELWMINNRKKLKANLLIGVGAAFDFLTGKEKQAPIWIQKTGFEWFFRLIQNPKRLWRRYALNNVLFLYKILTSLINGLLNRIIP